MTLQDNNFKNKAYMTKLWNYINVTKSDTVELSGAEQFEICKTLNKNVCIINVNGKRITYKKITYYSKAESF